MNPQADHKRRPAINVSIFEHVSINHLYLALE